MMPCPQCGEPAGFHDESCGHFQLPADWDLLASVGNGEILEAIWVDLRLVEHHTRYYMAYRDKWIPGWVGEILP